MILNFATKLNFVYTNVKNCIVRLKDTLVGYQTTSFTFVVTLSKTSFISASYCSQSVQSSANPMSFILCLFQPS